MLGLRCLTLLLRYPETQHIPVIIYSVVERAEVVQELEKLPSHVFFLRKDVDDAVLVRHLGSVFAALATEPSHAFSWASRLWQSLEVKPGWLGVGIDLKRLLGVNRPGRKSK
jgi:hypothetical protein